uniref:Large ribosomal subunit protein bL20c n=1 Tax=Entransia fimbriata TaxID=130991 RepID=A0A191T4T4_9VIRI|nr:ribosomal protein L20 [Entransia fimbriata]ANI25399.1 ribosomal protein L20 [Entransia fimbriata]WKT05789.1 ribosomal protein L20 [Entransia fimbriata]WKT05908.1 ribosomal protein L20 [Entransia fimbriata]
MTRVKRGYIARKRKQKILHSVSGSQGARSILFRTAKQQFIKNLTYSYQNRKKRKKDFRLLWILRINNFVKSHNSLYNNVIHSLQSNNIHLNRKMLAQISVLDPIAFHQIVE